MQAYFITVRAMHDDVFFWLDQHVMSCIVLALVICIFSSWELLFAKSRIKIKGLSWNRSVLGWWHGGVGMVSSTFSRQAMCCASCSSSLLRCTYDSFSNCSDTCTLHVCKLCLNSSDDFQFMAFSTFFQDYIPKWNGILGRRKTGRSIFSC